MGDAGRDRFLLVRGHWGGFRELDIIRPEHFGRGEAVLAAGTYSACWAAHQLLRQPPRRPTYTDGNELALGA